MIGRLVKFYVAEGVTLSGRIYDKVRWTKIPTEPPVDFYVIKADTEEVYLVPPSGIADIINEAN